MNTVSRQSIGAAFACGALALLAQAALAQSHHYGKSTPSAQQYVERLDPPIPQATPPVKIRGPRLTCRGICPGEPSDTVEQPAAPPPSVSMEISFDFDSDRIQPQSTEALDHLAKAMQHERLGAKRFDVVGHTDATGRFDYNMDLSRRRAMAVRTYLVGRGVDPRRLNTIGKGPTDPLDRADPRAAENRRVQIAVAG